jgi:hypothetical protein
MTPTFTTVYTPSLAWKARTLLPGVSDKDSGHPTNTCGRVVILFCWHGLHR